MEIINTNTAPKENILFQMYCLQPIQAVSGGNLHNLLPVILPNYTLICWIDYISLLGYFGVRVKGSNLAFPPIRFTSSNGPVMDDPWKTSCF
jgi:hypothetical protein